MDIKLSQLKKITLYSIILLLLVIFIQAKASSGKVYKGLQAPSFELTDLNGASRTLSHLSAGNKLTALVFWTTWNEQSSKELERLQKFYELYQSSGFQVIAVNVEDQTISKKHIKNIAKYCKKKGITFPVLIDRNLEIFYKYSIIAIPTTCLISAEGTVVYKLPGYPIVGSEQLFSFIKDTIAPEQKHLSTDRNIFKMPDEKAIRYYQMAKILRKNGDLTSAVQAFRQSITIDPDFLAPYNQLGTILYEEGMHKEAAELFERVLSGNPDDISFLTDYGNFLFKTGNNEKGLEVINKVLKQDSDYSAAHYFLGNYFLRQGQKNKALEEARIAVSLNPFGSNGHRLLGRIYESMGEKSKSLEAYKQAAKLLEKKIKPKKFPFLSLVINTGSL